LASSYTAASRTFDAAPATQQLARSLHQSPAQIRKSIARGERFGGVKIGSTPGRVGASAHAFRKHAPTLLLLLRLAAVAAAALVCSAKVVLRRSRYVTRDPRRVAGACRRELV